MAVMMVLRASAERRCRAVRLGYRETRVKSRRLRRRTAQATARQHLSPSLDHWRMEGSIQVASGVPGSHSLLIGSRLRCVEGPGRNCAVTRGSAQPTRRPRCCSYRDGDLPHSSLRRMRLPVRPTFTDAHEATNGFPALPAQSHISPFQCAHIVRPEPGKGHELSGSRD